uniref:Uncharacterized protein n=1 Tax=Opuntia streptacantha TaxID=393608 RepID=A0A7C8Z788_OPUST
MPNLFHCLCFPKKIKLVCDLFLHFLVHRIQIKVDICPLHIKSKSLHIPNICHHQLQNSRMLHLNNNIALATFQPCSVNLSNGSGTKRNFLKCVKHFTDVPPQLLLYHMSNHLIRSRGSLITKCHEPSHPRSRS